MLQNYACNDYVSQELCELFNAHEKAQCSFLLLDKTIHGQTQQTSHDHCKNHIHENCFGS